MNKLEQVKKFVRERKNLHESSCNTDFARGEEIKESDAKRKEAKKILEKIEEVEE